MTSIDISHMGVPFRLRDNYTVWGDTNISSVRYTELRKLQLELDANRDAIKDLAAVIPHTGWSQSKIADILSKDSPGDEILHELGILNRTLNDILDYLFRIEFWPGLQIFGTPFPPILQIQLPKSITVRAGQPLRIVTKAAGIPAPIYQWFFYPRKDAAPRKIEGQNKATLSIPEPRWLNDGYIVCSICNVQNQIYTGVCHVTVEHIVEYTPPTVTQPGSILPLPVSPLQQPSLPPEPPSKYTAKDKVALLIGNGKYMNEKKLDAPPNDILKIGERLNKMKFRTLICKDLNKAGMENILTFFINLLIEGVYGVLYFAGHGFETHKGNSFLVPSDSPIDTAVSSCISVTSVINRILEKNPALCLVVLDICRVRKTSAEGTAPPTTRNKSTMIVYATNENQKAWERADMKEPLSVFSSHLLKHIDDHIPLTQLMTQKVVPSLGEDDVAKSNGQNAEIVLTLSEPRSLHDRIDYSGKTTEFFRNRREWDNVNERPALREKDIPSLGIKVKMVFTHLYSNSLIIHIGCIKQDMSKAFSANAHVSWVNPLGCIGNATLMLNREKWPAGGFNGTPNCLSVTENIIDGIENLDEDLLINVLVEGSTQDGEKVSETIEKINLKRPLLARLKYDHRLQGRQVPLRIPVQHEERNEPVQNDESYYQPVFMERHHSGGHQRNYLLDSTDSLLTERVDTLNLDEHTDS